MARPKRHDAREKLVEALLGFDLCAANPAALRRAFEALPFVGLTNRRLLCMFGSCHKFIQLHYGSVKRLWGNVVADLQACRGLMIFLVAPWSDPWINWICALMPATVVGASAEAIFFENLSCGGRTCC